MRRFSILTLMGCVLASGVGFAALRDANEAWASLMGLVTLALLGVAVLGVAQRAARKEGFLVARLRCCSAASATCSRPGPWVADVARPSLPATHLPYFIHSKVAGSETGTMTIYTTATTTFPSGPGGRLVLQDYGQTAKVAIRDPSPVSSVPAVASVPQTFKPQRFLPARRTTSHSSGSAIASLPSWPGCSGRSSQASGNVVEAGADCGGHACQRDDDHSAEIEAVGGRPRRRFPIDRSPSGPGRRRKATD